MVIMDDLFIIKIANLAIYKDCHISEISVPLHVRSSKKIAFILFQKKLKVYAEIQLLFIHRNIFYILMEVMSK